MKEQEGTADGAISRRRVLAIGAGLLGVAALAACGGDDDSGATPTEGSSGAAVQLVDVAKGQELLADTTITVIDVRTPEEFASGHLARAELVDFNAGDFADRIATYDRAGRYFVYCRSGNRSGQATSLMAQMGFTEVYDLDGGMVAWTAAGAPVEG